MENHHSRRFLTLITCCLCLLGLNLAFSMETFGEYRAFRLRIFRPEDGTERFAQSTLDSIQYPAYFPLQKGETIEIQKTWRCPGNTGNFKSLCSPPEEK